VSTFLTVDDVIAIHDYLSDAPIIDAGKLAGAVMRPQSTYYGVFLHASIFEQASVLLHGICQAHGFLDGNKRTAWVSMVTFLELNGLEIVNVPAPMVVTFMEEVAEGLHAEKSTAGWIVTLIRS
jgi:death-on-curing protein